MAKSYCNECQNSRQAHVCVTVHEYAGCEVRNEKTFKNQSGDCEDYLENEE